MSFSHKWVFAILLLLCLSAIAPGVQAQQQCEAEYDLALGVLSAAALPERVSQTIDTKLYGARMRTQSIQPKSMDRALAQVDEALALAAGADVAAVPPDLLTAVRGATKAYRDCVAATPAPRGAKVRVAVTRPAATGEHAPVAKARVRVNREFAGVTDAEGMLTVTVAADQPLVIGAFDGNGFAGGADVTARFGAVTDAAIAMTEGSGAEPNELMLEELRADGLLPHDFSTLTLRFTDDDQNVRVDAIGEILLQNESGASVTVDAMFGVNDAGAIVVTRPDLFREALRQMPGTLSLHVDAYGADGVEFANTVTFQLGRHRMTGQLTDSISTAGVAMANAYVSLTATDGRVYRALSDENGNFSFAYLPVGTLRLEARQTVNGVEYEASKKLEIEADQIDMTLPMSRSSDLPGRAIRSNSTSGAGLTKRTINTEEVVLKSISDTTRGKCAINGQPGAPVCNKVDIFGEWFEIPQNTGKVTLRFRVTSEETVARATLTGGPIRDSFAIGLRIQSSGYLAIDNGSDTRRLYLDGDMTLPGTSRWIEYYNDFTNISANGPVSVRLETRIYNCCNGDNTLHSDIYGEVYIENSCPVGDGASTGTGAIRTEVECPPTLSITNLQVVPPPLTSYGRANNDGHVFSIPRPGRFNHYPRKFTAIIKKTPADATFAGDVTLYSASTDEQLTTIRVLTPLTQIPNTTDSYYLPVSFDEPLISSRVQSTPPPAHFIRYRFNFQADSNGQVVNKIVLSDPAPIRQRALWRMPDIFNDRRYGGAGTHLNGGDGEPGGDSWASRGAYEWMERNEQLLTRINDISGEHGVDLGHDGHGYGTDIDQFHYTDLGTATTEDPAGTAVFDALKSAAQTAQNPGSPGRAAAIATLTEWVSASREGIDNLLALPEVAQVGYITHGPEYRSKRRAIGGGSTSGLLPLWGRDLLKTGRIVYGNGAVVDTGQGAWANGAHAKMQYWKDHYHHIHITLNRCIVDSDGCAVSTSSCTAATVSESPQDATINAGQSTTLSVGASGSGTLHYQWYATALSSNDEIAIPNSNSSSITVSPAQSMIYRVEVTGSCGSDESAPAVVTVNQVCVPPSVTAQPVDQSIISGDTATLSVEAAGSASSYQWYYGASGNTAQTVPNGTGATLSITPASFTTVWVRIINECGTVDSASAAIHVSLACVPISINTSPSSKSIIDGELATLTVHSSGTGPYDFDWFIGESGDTSQPLTNTNYSIKVSPDATTDYWVRVSNACGSANSATARVTVLPGCTPPTITAQPHSSVITAGNSATLSVSLTGSASTVQWFTSSGANAGTGRTVSVTPSSTTTYYARITNACGTVDSTAVTVTVNPAPTYCTNPVITTQPAASTVILSGDTATFTVAADVTGIAVTYQWYRGEAGDLSQPVGENLPSYTTDVLLEDARYWVRLSRGSCSTDSVVASVTVCGLSTTIGDVYSRAGQTVNLTAQVYNVRDNAEMNFTWYRGAAGDTSNPLQSGPWYQTISVAPTSTTQYWVSVTDGTCSAISNTATVSTCMPIINTQPQSQLINSGTTATLTVAATGDNLSYQWYQRGTTLTPVGTNSPTFTTPALTSDTTYYVRVRGCTNVNSADAVISICRVPTAHASQVTHTTTSGQGVMLSINSGGTAPALQWYQGVSGDTSTPLAGKTSSTLSVAPAATTQYWCRVTNQCGTANSQTITVDVCNTPVITTQPANVAIPAGTAATLSVVASTSPGAVSYQWYQGGEGDTSTPVGTNASTLTTDVLLEDATFWVRVTRGACHVNSAVATVSACSLTASLNSALIRSGQSINLSATVYGSRDFPTYSWYRGNTGDVSNPIAVGTPSSTLAVAPTATTSYWFRVTDGTCTIDSNTATVSVCVPEITAQPQSVMINSGQTTTLSVTATGENLSYQWYQRTGSTSVAVGTNSPTFTTPALTTNTTYWVRVSSCTNAISQDVVVSICQLPTVSSSQLTYTIPSGNGAVLSVTAGGTSPTYQWYQGASGVTTTPLAGKTSSSLTVAPSSTTQYWCRITNPCGTANGPTTTVDVCTTPSITAQPANTSVPFNSAATLSVTATTSAGAVVYQWYQGDAGDTSTPVGTNSSTFITPLMTADTSYWVRITRGACSTNSAAAMVYACQLTAGLPDRQSKVGQTVTLPASVSGARDFVTYDWYRGIAGDTSNPIALGTAGATLTVAPTVTTKYWFRVTDGTCTVVSNTATVSVCVPTISAQPQSVLINSGQTTTLSVTTTGENLSYQWYQRTGSTSTPVGTNSRTFTTPALTANATYWVRVSGCSVVDSTDAVVTICQLPTVSSSQTAFAIAYGQSAVMSVTAGGTSPTYQWYQGASGVTTTPLSGKTSSSLTMAPAATTQYWCRITNPCGTVNGPTITVDVCTSPVIGTQPATISVPYNSSTTLSVSATASAGTINYQWYRGDAGDMSAPVGTNSSTFTTPLMTVDTSYWVRVTRGACATNSAAATVYACQLSASLGDRWIKSGQTTTVDASVSNARAAVTYSWYRGNVGDVSNPIAIGTTAASISVAPTVTTKYWARVTDGTCTVSTNASTVSVCVPNITAQPASVMINNGQSTTLTVTSTGEGLTYQWYAGAAGVTTTPVGTNSPSLTVSPASTTSYWVRITGCSAVNSTAATVTVCVLPSISQQPNGYTITRYNSASVSVTASGTNLSYQWYRGDAGVTTTPVGTNSPTYTSAYTQTTKVWVRVTGSCGAVNSNATTVSVYPIVATQPADTRITRGTPATFSVSTDSTTISYQWYQGQAGDTSRPVTSGGTGATLTTVPLTVDTQYFVRLTSGSAMVDSTTATAFICPAPTVNVSNPTQVSGSWATLSVTDAVEGDTYKWYRGNSGDTSVLVADTGVTPQLAVNPTQTTNYWVRATNPVCSADSATATVNVCVPAITSQPQNASITQGQTTRLSGTATGTPALTYQWYTTTPSVAAIPGATNSYVDVTPSSTMTYYVRVTSAASCAVNSNVVTVSVCQLPVITAISGGGSQYKNYTTGVSVTATGTNLSYQWYRGQSGDTTYPVFTNVRNPSFTASSTQYYWVRVTNSCGSVNSAAVLNSVYPTAGGPVSVTIPTGTSTTLNVNANGTYLTYQWYINGYTQAIPGATGPTYITPNLTTETTYYCLVKSGNATIYPYAVVSICAGGPTLDSTFTYANGPSCFHIGVNVNYMDAGNVSYAWYQGEKGDTSYPIGSDQYYTTVCPSVQTKYWCRVSYADGSCYTDTATITVR